MASRSLHAAALDDKLAAGPGSTKTTTAWTTRHCRPSTCHARGLSTGGWGHLVGLVGGLWQFQLGFRVDWPPHITAGSAWHWRQQCLGRHTVCGVSQRDPSQRDLPYHHTHHAMMLVRFVCVVLVLCLCCEIRRNSGECAGALVARALLPGRAHFALGAQALVCRAHLPALPNPRAVCGAQRASALP